MDFGRSDHPGVQDQLDRLAALSVPQGRLGLETMTALMERLDNPHRKLPPTFHVAGTNGKGSVCAFLRAMLEADGKRVHVTTSPHLVRYNERIRLAGKLIEDEPLAALLEEVLDAGEDLAPSFFEVTIAAAFLAFSRTPADACVVEVGLGGRFDATNVLEPDVLAACGIAALGIDHERFLLAPEEGAPTEPMARIAFEKAGIAKKGVPLVTMGRQYPEEAHLVTEEIARQRGLPIFRWGCEWDCDSDGSGPLTSCRYYEDERNFFRTDALSLPGSHQAYNAGLAIGMIRQGRHLAVSDDALIKGAGRASWPARMQRLDHGPLRAIVGDQPIWLDGGHNASAGAAIARQIQGQVHLVLGMLSNKNWDAIIGSFAGRIRSLTIVPVPHHDCHPAQAFGPNAKAASDVEEALVGIPSDDYPILIAGSLYLAAEVLRLNDEIPD